VARSRLPADPQPGERVGSVEALVAGRVVGSVPAVVGAAGPGPTPPPAPSGGSIAPAAGPWERMLRPLGILAVVLREMVGAFL